MVTGATWLVGPFVAAGTLRWPAIWFYLAVIALGAVAQQLYVARHNPTMSARRRRIGAGTKRWDLLWVFLFGPLTVLPPLVAGLDVRAGEALMHPAWSAFGAILNTAGGIAWARAMAVNPHFESTVRIQSEFGHQVVDRGPYGTLRHPGYAAFCVGSLGAPLMLLSWSAVAVGLLLPLAFIVRTALEDATLRRELPGYEAYAQRVRYRLVPGVW